MLKFNLKNLRGALLFAACAAGALDALDAVAAPPKTNDTLGLVTELGIDASETGVAEKPNDEKLGVFDAVEFDTLGVNEKLGGFGALVELVALIELGAFGEFLFCAEVCDAIASEKVGIFGEVVEVVKVGDVGDGTFGAVAKVGTLNAVCAL